MDKIQKTERLKKLIDGSAAFDANDKLNLIVKIPELTEGQMDDAIRVFEEEIDDWKAIFIKHEENKSMLMTYINKSQHELARMSQDVIHMSENSTHAIAEAEAETLLTTI